MNNIFEKIKEKVNHKRTVLLYIVGFIFFILIVVFLLSLDAPNKDEDKAKNSVMEISVPIDTDLINRNWKNTYETEQKGLRSQNENLQEKLSQMNKQLSTIQEKNLKDQEEMQRQVQEQIDWQMKELRETMGAKSGNLLNNLEREHKIVRHEINLNRPIGERNNAINTIDNAIPAGTFVKAYLMHEIAAHTAVSSASDPLPVTFELIDDLNLPQKLKKNFKDCRVIGSAYGNLSSERIYVRLEELSCVNKNTGELIITDLVGYVVDVGVGIAGTVVSRDFKYLQNGFVGGVFSGLGKTLGQTNTVSPLFSMNGQISAIPTGEAFKSGMAEGSSSSLDRLSKYYLDRAESLYPVLYAPSGRIVDLVFKRSAVIGSTINRKTIAEEKKIAKEKMQKYNEVN